MSLLISALNILLSIVLHLHYTYHNVLYKLIVAIKVMIMTYRQNNGELSLSLKDKYIKDFTEKYNQELRDNIVYVNRLYCILTNSIVIDITYLYSLYKTSRGIPKVTTRLDSEFIEDIAKMYESQKNKLRSLLVYFSDSTYKIIKLDRLYSLFSESKDKVLYLGSVQDDISQPSIDDKVVSEYDSFLSEVENEITD